MRITILALGSRGDVQPYIHLGKGLKDAGHRVRVATFEAFAPMATAAGLEFLPHPRRRPGLASNRRRRGIPQSQSQSYSSDARATKILRHTGRQSASGPHQPVRLRPDPQPAPGLPLWWRFGRAPGHPLGGGRGHPAGPHPHAPAHGCTIAPLAPAGLQPAHLPPWRADGMAALSQFGQPPAHPNLEFARPAVLGTIRRHLHEKNPLSYTASASTSSRAHPIGVPTFNRPAGGIPKILTGNLHRN